MADALLVLNAGSSSLKFAVYVDQDPPAPLMRGQIEGLQTRPRFTARGRTSVLGVREWPAGTRLSHEDAVAYLLTWGRGDVLAGHRIVAVGHRVVHGGTRCSEPRLVDAELLDELAALVPLAPLHQPHNVAAIEAVARAAPSLPQVACFDTSFHRTQPDVAQLCAVPARFRDEGIWRYGFHGLSYEYVASVLAAADRRAATGRTVVAHLGNGASMCAMRGCRSVATTMGFSTLDGLVMGTRCGALDPGVVLYLMERHDMSVAETRQLLYEQCGLLGISGISGDMRVLLASGDPAAAAAVDLFVYRITRELGSLAAALGGLDAIVFTGGIGENAPDIRARVCEGARWLGVELDEDANAGGSTRITRADSPIVALVVPANEEVMIARHTRRVRAAVRPSPGRMTYESH